MKILHTTPAQDGFYMPAEFAPHEGCLMSLAGTRRQLAVRRLCGPESLSACDRDDFRKRKHDRALLGRAV